jgi:hypothetical protein
VRMQVAANELYERRIAQGAGRRNPVTARRPRRP